MHSRYLPAAMEGGAGPPGTLPFKEQISWFMRRNPPHTHAHPHKKLTFLPFSRAPPLALLQGSWCGRGPSLSQAVQVTMLTGDNAASAERVARKLGITSVYAALSPEQKLARVAELQRGGRGGVIMVSIYCGVESLG